MLSTPMEQGLLSVSLSLVGKVKCWLMRSQAVMKPISIIVREVLRCQEGLSGTGLYNLRLGV